MVTEHRNQAGTKLDAPPCQLALVPEGAAEEDEVMVPGEVCHSPQ